MSPYLHALVAAVSRSGNDILYRRFVQKSADPLMTACVNALGGGVFLLLLVGHPSLTGITEQAVVLLLAANVCWAAQTYFYIRALKFNDVAVNGLLECSRFVLLFLAGVVFFGEPFTISQIAGIALVCSSILIGSNIARIGIHEGTVCSALSVASGALALVADKALTTLLDPLLVVLAGFFLPGAIYLLVSPRCLGRAATLDRAGILFLISTTILMSCTGYNLIYAFAGSGLGLSMSIYQIHMVMSAILGLLLLSERKDPVRRLVGSIMCIVGIAIVSAS